MRDDEDEDDDDYPHPGRGGEGHRGLKQRRGHELVRRERTRSPRRRDVEFRGGRRRAAQEEEAPRRQLSATPTGGANLDAFASVLSPTGGAGSKSPAELQALFSVKANALKQGLLQEGFTQQLQQQTEDFFLKANQLAHWLGIGDVPSPAACRNAAWSKGAAPSATSASMGAQSTSPQQCEWLIPAHRVFGRIKSATAASATSLLDVEQALFRMQVTAATGNQENADLGREGLTAAMGRDGLLRQEGDSTLGGPGQDGSLDKRKPAHGDGCDRMTSDGPQHITPVHGAEGEGVGSDEVEAPPVDGNAAPSVYDFFDMPEPPVLPHKPMRTQRKKRTFDMSTVLKEYVSSIQGPLPDYVIAALSTLLDLDDDGATAMTDALLQYAGDDAADLQAELDGADG
ncbi:unnamed protein product [Urochloa humidicola]